MCCRGCTDNSACNYNHSANIDDGSCLYDPNVGFNTESFIGDIGLQQDITINVISWPAGLYNTIKSYEFDLNNLNIGQYVGIQLSQENIDLEKAKEILDTGINELIPNLKTVEINPATESKVIQLISNISTPNSIAATDEFNFVNV